jgi:hypothetical protein
VPVGGLHHPRGRLAEPRPLGVVEGGGDPVGAGRLLGVQLVDDHQELAAEAAEEDAELVQLRRRRAPGVRILEVELHEPAGEAEAARGELALEHVRVGRQVAERPELRPPVPGLDDLVEEARPRRLARVVGEPHAPRVRGAPELQRRGSHP